MSPAGGERLQSPNTRMARPPVFTCSESATRAWRTVYNYWTPSTDIPPTTIALTFKKSDETVSAERRVTIAT